MQDHGGYLLDYGDGGHFPNGEVFDRVVQNNSVFFESTLDAAVDTLHHPFLRFQVHLRQLDDFGCPQYLLGVEETDEVLEHVHPHFVGEVQHQLPHLCLVEGSEIILQSLDHLIETLLLQSFDFLLYVELQPLADLVDLGESLEDNPSQLGGVDVSNKDLDEDIIIGDVFFRVEGVNEQIEQVQKRIEGESGNH